MFGTNPQTDLSLNILSDQVLQKIIIEKNVSETDESDANRLKKLIENKVNYFKMHIAYSNIEIQVK